MTRYSALVTRASVTPSRTPGQQESRHVPYVQFIVADAGVFLFQASVVGSYLSFLADSAVLPLWMTRIASATPQAEKNGVSDSTVESAGMFTACGALRCAGVKKENGVLCRVFSFTWSTSRHANWRLERQAKNKQRRHPTWVERAGEGSQEGRGKDRRRRDPSEALEPIPSDDDYSAAEKWNCKQGVGTLGRGVCGTRTIAGATTAKSRQRRLTPETLSCLPSPRGESIRSKNITAPTTAMVVAASKGALVVDNIRDFSVSRSSSCDSPASRTRGTRDIRQKPSKPTRWRDLRLLLCLPLRFIINSHHDRP